MKKQLTYLETIELLGEAKKIFESQIETRLDLVKVGSPLFVPTDSGLQDDLTGVEEAVSFKYQDKRYEIVHSLAKWKRETLGKYQFPVGKGLYTEMKAIRKDEKVDEIHSLYVEQWDFEKVITKEDRTIDYLKETVRKLYKSLRQTSCILKQKYHFLTLDLPKTITFITSQELEKMYPKESPEVREQLFVREKKAVFIIGIGEKLASGEVHDKRSPDYDDWQLNGDLLVFDKVLDKAIELVSMGIRVDAKSLMDQLEKAGKKEKQTLPYHQKVLKGEVPYTIGGGIGMSRVFLLLLEKSHIAEVQASYWGEEEKILSDKPIL